AGVVVGEDEAGALVVGLLRQHAIEADVAPRSEVSHARLPDAQAVAATAHLRAGDVLTEEAELVVVAGTGDAGDGFAGAFGQEEAGGIGGEEAGAVVQAGVPALALGPGAEQVDLVGPRPVDDDVGRVCTHRSPPANVAADLPVCRVFSADVDIC